MVTMKKVINNYLLNYKTYLFISIVCIALAPFSEIIYWKSRSNFFAYWAFFFFTIAIILLLWNDLAHRYNLDKIIKSFAISLWIKLQDILQ